MRAGWMVLAAAISVPSLARAAPGSIVQVELGPIKGAPSGARAVSFDLAARRKVTVHDVQDGREHFVRGVSLRELLAQAQAPRAADTAIFSYVDGMEIPVRLRDAREVDAIFLAFQHADDTIAFEPVYPVRDRFELPCPKVVYTRPIASYSIWLYPTELRAIRLVTWRLYEAQLAQPTRDFPDRSGWPLYLKHCQSCHGIGGQGAKRGPDFLSQMDAYRRIPPLAVTDRSEHPSLHEKVKGFTDGTMPVLSHIPSRDVATLWRWLHAIFRSATK